MKVPSGYTAEELERDNPFNQWMYEGERIMIVKTSELTGPALDWAVAKCEGELAHVQFSPLASSKHYFAPSKKWAQGGPIIDREKIATKYFDAAWTAEMVYENDDDGVTRFSESDGPTALIAAMRCYVASKLGEEVEVPNELL